MTDNTQPLQPGDRVRVTSHILPIYNRCADTSVRVGTTGYIEAKSHTNDSWHVKFGWFSRIVATADLERIADVPADGGDHE